MKGMGIVASVFRKTALERLSSPDRLDSMLKVTTPMSWIGIAAAAVLAISVVFWAFTGSLPTTVSTVGFLVDSYNTNTIYSNAAGMVSQVMVEPGMPIERDDPILEISSTTGKQVTVYSDQRGIVSRLLTGVGTEVTPSSELLRISPQTGNDLSIVCYVDLETARQLREGMQAGIYLNSGASGHMAGTVTNIDRCVSSTAAISELLGQDGQMAYALTQNGPLVAVTCELRADAAAASGYYFSGNGTPDSSLTSGEQVTVQITLDECAPIEKVFPMLG